MFKAIQVVPYDPNWSHIFEKITETKSDIIGISVGLYAGEDVSLRSDTSFGLIAAAIGRRKGFM